LLSEFIIHIRRRRYKVKNIKNTLLVTTAAVAAGLLAALCSGCDGSGGGEVGDGDAGRADTVRQDAVAASDVKPGTCTVPTPKFSLNGLVTATPRHGYVVVAVDSYPCSTYIAQYPFAIALPTNCEDPVDGFASGVDQVWCYVVTREAGGRVLPVASNSAKPFSLSCSWTGVQIMEQIKANVMTYSQAVFGDVAVCSPSGKFLGWTVGPQD
jgi:hypothetical protein